ncbi:hypothetical protein D3C85_1335420 [compost metagenome]
MVNVTLGTLAESGRPSPPLGSGVSPAMVFNSVSDPFGSAADAVNGARLLPINDSIMTKTNIILRILRIILLTVIPSV